MPRRRKEDAKEELPSNLSTYDILSKIGLKRKVLDEAKPEEKIKGTNDTYIQAIRTIRLHELIGSRYKCDIANAIGITPSTLTDYLNSGADPRSSILAKIAGYFNVSCDYLLGRTDIRSTDKSQISACKYLGLTDAPIDKIRDISKSSDHLLYNSLLSHFLESGNLEQIINVLNEAVGLIASFNTMYGKAETQYEQQLDSLEYKFTKTLGSIFRDFINSYLVKYENEVAKYIDANRESLAAAASEVEERLQSICEPYDADKDAYRIYMMTNGNQEDK